MNTTDTNIYRIQGLERYSAEYRLHRVRGLVPGDEDYFRNLQSLSNRLSRELRTPATFLLRGDDAFIVLRAGATPPKDAYQLVRATAVLDPPSDVFRLEFTRLDAETRPIALRFLGFAMQGAFWRHHDLWQPHGGGVFYEKNASQVVGNIGMHRGFLARIVDLGADGFGVCVDVRHKYVSSRALPVLVSRKEFNEQFKTRHAIYHYGREWFQIRLEECNDLSVTEFVITKDGRKTTLLEYIQSHSEKPLPTELANLPKDCSVLHYYNGRDEKMAAPSALCFPVFDTASPQVRREHGRTILRPDIRRQAIDEFTGKYLRTLKLDGNDYQLAESPVAAATRVFAVPDLEFGGGKILSTKGTPNAIRVGIGEFGRKRLALLRDKSAGFFATDPFHRQFFFMPQSIRDSWGPQFLNDLSVAVDAFYPQERGYEPTVIPYNDNRGPTWVDQGQAVVAAAKEQGVTAGFAVVMLHEPGARRVRQEDQLAAFVSRRLYDEFDIRTATMHTETGSNAYALLKRPDGSVGYQSRPEKRGKLAAYVDVVAINKVLLTNEKWPFVLAEPLHADVTIGVDIKSQHVGFTLVGRGGRYIDTRIRKTRFREHLRAAEFEKHLVDIVRQYHEREGEFAENIVIHRDGRLFQTERCGARTALQTLKENGFVSPAASLTCVEIGKHSYTSLRLFDVCRQLGRRDSIRNPCVGEFYIPGGDEGYLVATGRPFDRPGTTLPLHVRKVEGRMPIENILEDVYRLTTLTWSRPDDCSRYPITIKLNDRRLFEDAGEYEESEIEMQDVEAEL